MAVRETSHDIDAAAADWIARIDRGPLQEDEELAFQAWMNGDPRRRGAFLRADAFAMMSESARALGPHFDVRDFQESDHDSAAKTGASPAMVTAATAPVVHTRRSAMIWAGRGAVAAAALIAVGSAFSSAGAITTRRGEIRRVPLDDGSTMELNTDTSVKVLYDANRRGIQLLYGEVYFTVTRNDHRPFIVSVGEDRIQASLASFRVRCLQNRPIDVLVDQGGIEYAPASGAFRPIRMPQGTELTLPDRATGAPLTEPQPVPTRAITQQLAWREGKIAFKGERLDDAAAQFARYSDTRIRIDDPALAAEPITGLYAANDPVGFSRAIAGLLGAGVDRDGSTVILRRANRS